MTKFIEVMQKASLSATGEHIMGYDETGSHACYMIYGILKPGEKERRIEPGKGHEEIVLAAKGDIAVTGHFSGTLKEGSVFHIRGEHVCFLQNITSSDAVYIIAGGHSDDEHH